MPATIYRNRKSETIENDAIRLTVTAEGGNIAEVFHKGANLNPLWTPPWPSIEPSRFNTSISKEYGVSDEARILSAIMGHSLCLDTYGSPSREESLVGIPVHGEGSLVPYSITSGTNFISLTGVLPLAQVAFDRRIRLADNGVAIHFEESVSNLSNSDRPIAWTQHVVIGPPFLERGKTQLRIPVTRSRVFDGDFANGRGFQKAGSDFDGLLCPRKDGGFIDLRVFPDEDVSGGFTTHLLDPSEHHAFFVSWSPSTKLAFGYIWKRQDFPWLCRWEEQCLRSDPPWNSQTVACGLEFGVSPTLGSRREMVNRGALFGTPCFRWVPARSSITVNYCAFLRLCDGIPEKVTWDGLDLVEFHEMA